MGRGPDRGGAGPERAVRAGRGRAGVGAALTKERRDAGVRAMRRGGRSGVAHHFMRDLMPPSTFVQSLKSPPPCPRPHPLWAGGGRKLTALAGEAGSFPSQPVPARLALSRPHSSESEWEPPGPQGPTPGKTPGSMKVAMLKGLTKRKRTPL